MRIGQVLLGGVLLVGSTAVVGQITSNPLPAAVEKRGIAVEVRQLVQLPDTRGRWPIEQDVTPSGVARINFVRDLPDGRRFVNDSRGFLYLLDQKNTPHGLRGRGPDVSAVGVQPARERLRRVRLAINKKKAPDGKNPSGAPLSE